jgi:hypothetical protein
MKLNELRAQGLLIMAGVLVSSARCITPVAWGEEFRVAIPQLAGDYYYGQSRGPASFDIGACVTNVAAIRVEISGTHYMGWWDGDDVEDYYHGPMAGGIFAAMNRSAGWQWEWSASSYFSATGPFNRTLTLGPRLNGHDSSFLNDGTSDLYVYQPILVGWGMMTVSPLVSVSSVTVVIEAQRVIRISSFSLDGSLSWTPTPTQGVTHIEFTPTLTEPWTRVASTPGTNTCCTVTLPADANAGFFRVCYSPE